MKTLDYSKCIYIGTGAPEDRQSNAKDLTLRFLNVDFRSQGIPQSYEERDVAKVPHSEFTREQKSLQGRITTIEASPEYKREDFNTAEIDSLRAIYEFIQNVQEQVGKNRVRDERYFCSA